MKNELEKIKIENKVVSIYYDREDNWKFTVGYVNSINDDYVILDLISSDGLEDGYMVLQLNNIFQIDNGGMYENKIEKLMNLNQTKIENIKLDEKDLLRSFINYISKINLVANFYMCDGSTEDITGLVSEIHNNIVKIKKVDNFGQNDGESTILLDDIAIIICNTNKEKMLKLLFKSEYN